MRKIYMIEVHLYPNNDTEISKPFFWCLQSCLGKDWCTETAGWESSAELAWKAAYCFFQNKQCDVTDEKDIILP